MAFGTRLALVSLFFSARATHDARCCNIGFYLAGKANGQKRVPEGTLTLGVELERLLFFVFLFVYFWGEPERLLYEATGCCGTNVYRVLTHSVLAAPIRRKRKLSAKEMSALSSQIGLNVCCHWHPQSV